MSEGRDRASLDREKYELEQRHDACQRRIDSRRGELERLYPVKRRLSEAKDAFKALKKCDHATVTRGYDWEGSRFERFERGGEALREENDSYYKTVLDAALDALNDYITRAENDLLDDVGLLGVLAAGINSLANEIENLFN